MKGIPLHPLRIRALDRMKMLRVPFRKQPLWEKVLRVPFRKQPLWEEDPGLSDDGVEWCGRYRYGTMDSFDVAVDFHKPPYAPGDYFVKEAFRHIAHGRNYGVRVQYEYNSIACYQKVFDPCPNKDDKWRPTSWKNRSAAIMPEWAARYLLTLGPPVPCRLGEVDVVQQRDEGVIIDIGDEYRRTWDALYPKHPYSPDLWTWGYPMEVRR